MAEQLTVEGLRRLARAATIWDPARRRESIDAERQALGAPTDGELADAAIAGLGHPDRNVRVAMLRVLGMLFRGPRVVDGVLAGLRDPMRRVREVAIRVGQHNVDDDRVVSALTRIVEDDAETNRLRGLAFFVLSRSMDRGVTPGIVSDALATLAATNGYRSRVLRRLCAVADVTPDIEKLLREFVRLGSKEEAVQATRALCGYRLVRLADVPADDRALLAAASERDALTGDYWVPRTARVG